MDMQSPKVISMGKSIENQGGCMKAGIRVSQRTWRWALALASVVSLIVAVDAAVAEHGPIGKPAVDPNLTSYNATREVAGSLKLAGSDTMQPILSRLAKEFRRYHPNALLSIEGGGSSAAVKEFLDTPS